MAPVRKKKSLLDALGGMPPIGIFPGETPQGPPQLIGGLPTATGPQITDPINAQPLHGPRNPVQIDQQHGVGGGPNGPNAAAWSAQHADTRTPEQLAAAQARTKALHDAALAYNAAEPNGGAIDRLAWMNSPAGQAAQTTRTAAEMAAGASPAYISGQTNALQNSTSSSAQLAEQRNATNAAYGFDVYDAKPDPLRMMMEQKYGNSLNWQSPPGADGTILSPPPGMSAEQFRNLDTPANFQYAQNKTSQNLWDIAQEKQLNSPFNPANIIMSLANLGIGAGFGGAFGAFGLPTLGADAVTSMGSSNPLRSFATSLGASALGSSGMFDSITNPIKEALGIPSLSGETGMSAGDPYADGYSADGLHVTVHPQPPPGFFGSLSGGGLALGAAGLGGAGALAAGLGGGSAAAGGLPVAPGPQTGGVINPQPVNLQPGGGLGLGSGTSGSGIGFTGGGVSPGLLGAGALGGGALLSGLGGSSGGSGGASNTGFLSDVGNFLGLSGGIGGSGISLAQLLGLGGSIYSGISGTNTANNIANAELAANTQALNFQKGVYADTTKNLKPFLTTGTASNNRLGSMLGVTGSATAPGYGSLMKPFTGADLVNTPGYQFQLQQGTQALNRSLGAQGNLFSGQAMKAAEDYGQGLAGTTFNDAFQRDQSTKNQLYNFLSGSSASGQNAAALQGTAGANFATQAGNLATSAGNIQGANLSANNNFINQSLANALNGITGGGTSSFNLGNSSSMAPVFDPYTGQMVYRR